MAREIHLTIDDKRASTWWRMLRVLLIVGAIAWAWKTGYDQGGQDMLNQFIITEPAHTSEEKLFTSL
tara:strand:+ start:529 stop:729 length:201 start_codon:yes stop_codon:yes gene_type:complete